MANKVTEVFRVTVPSVGLTLKVRGDIDGKQAAYSRRIKDDDRYDGGDDALLTEYFANVDCKFNFDGGNPENDITFVAGSAPVVAMPFFFETRYFIRGDFKAGDGRSVKDVRVEHRMASVTDAFNFDDCSVL